MCIRLGERGQSETIEYMKADTNRSIANTFHEWKRGQKNRRRRRGQFRSAAKRENRENVRMSKLNRPTPNRCVWCARRETSTKSRSVEFETVFDSLRWPENETDATDILNDISQKPVNRFCREITKVYSKPSQTHFCRMVTITGNEENLRLWKLSNSKRLLVLRQNNETPNFEKWILRQKKHLNLNTQLWSVVYP